MDIENVFQKNFKRIRIQKGLTQKDVADSLNVSKSLINHWEKGKSSISFDKIIKLSDSYGIDLNQFNDILDEDGKRYYKIPVLGEIACGLPIFAQENIQTYKMLPIEYRSKGQYFYLKAKGKSMIDVGIEPGDYLLMKKVSVLNKNDIGAFLFKDDNEVNLKIYSPELKRDRIILKSANSEFKDFVFTGKEIEKIQIFAKLELVEKRDYDMNDIINNL